MSAGEGIVSLGLSTPITRIRENGSYYGVMISQV